MNHRNSQADAETADLPVPARQSVEIHPAVITWALIIGLIVAFAVTASSFKLSFATLYDLAAMAGMRDSSWVIPVVLDGPILAAGIFRIALSQHTDRATVRGRRFIIAVFALAGLASMAGNAYHAILTVADLNAAVAAAIGALAPLMVMTMSEMISIAISAPRRRTHEAAQADPVDTAVDLTDESVSESASDTEQMTAIVDDHGILDPAVWETVDLYLNHAKAKGNFSAVGRLLGLTPSAVSRRYDKWLDLMNEIAAIKAGEQRPSTSAAGEDNITPAEDSTDDYTPTDAQFDYAGSNQ